MTTGRVLIIPSRKVFILARRLFRLSWFLFGYEYFDRHIVKLLVLLHHAEAVRSVLLTNFRLYISQVMRLIVILLSLLDMMHVILVLLMFGNVRSRFRLLLFIARHLTRNVFPLLRRSMLNSHCESLGHRSILSIVFFPFSLLLDVRHLKINDFIAAVMRLPISG